MAKKKLPNKVEHADDTASGPSLHVKGLVNLGNTCYFNALLQCIFVTPGLAQQLSNRCENESSHVLLKSDEKGAVQKKTVTLEAGRPGLTFSLYTFIRDRVSHAGHYLSPKKLRQFFVQQSPRFDDFNQHDSHEAFLSLSNCLKAEELSRFKAVLEEGEDQSEEDIKNWLHVAERSTVVDMFFGGVFVTSFKCERCREIRQIFDPFICISLPIPQVDSPTVDSPMPLREYNNKSDKVTRPLSKKQQRAKLKKDRKLQRKRKGNQYDFDSNKSVTEPDDTENADDSKPSKSDEEDATETTEKEDEETEEATDCGSVVEDPDSFVTPKKQPVDGQPLSSQLESDSDVRLAEEFASMTLDPRKQALMMGNSPLSTYMSSPESTAITLEDCLASFTKEETLEAGLNISCTRCSSKAKEAKSNGASIRRDLVLSAPPILVLHLKRFKVERNHPIKLNKFIEFPLRLNLSPFCCQLSSTGVQVMYRLFGVIEHKGCLKRGHYVSYVGVSSEKEQPYWEVRPLRIPWPLRPEFFTDLATSRQLKRELFESCNGARTAEPEPLTWFICDDERVSRVDSSVVLKAEAFVLFYERIL